MIATTTDWRRVIQLVEEQEFDDVELGVIKSGKEATVSLVERRLGDDSRVLLARKRYRFDNQFTKRDPYLEGAYAHRADLPYAMRAAELRNGRALAGWQVNEFRVLRRMWDAGANVPCPVAFDGDVYMEFLGTDRQAAPRLESLTPDAASAARWFASLVDDMHELVNLLLVHADLSPYNVLIHNGEAFVIDLPQAVPIGRAPNAFALLRRDVANVVEYFERYFACPSVDDVIADLMRYAPWR